MDGHLFDVPIPEHIHKLESAVIARLKIMAHLDVSERRIPQDGRINLSHEGQSIDVRVATIPSIEGETVSLRLLNQQRFNLDLLEMEPLVRKEIEELLTLTNGVILVTGPTGSGKSTSLYSFLDKLNKPETRTVTIEDPVENKLPGIVQIAVRSEVGLTFAKGLRSILRADPNIVMVGEIRDTETAEIAIRASLTGHGTEHSAHQFGHRGGQSSCGHGRGALFSGGFSAECWRSVWNGSTLCSLPKADGRMERATPALLWGFQRNFPVSPTRQWLRRMSSFWLFWQDCSV